MIRPYSCVCVCVCVCACVCALTFQSSEVTSLLLGTSCPPSRMQCLRTSCVELLVLFSLRFQIRAVESPDLRHTHTQTCYWYLTFLLNQKNTPKTTTSTGHWFLFKVVRQQVSFFSHRWGNMWARGHSDCESQQDDMLGLSQEIWSDINITLLLNEI